MTQTEQVKKGWTKNDWLLLGFNIAVVIILFLTFNSKLPDYVGSHTSFSGKLDRTMPKAQLWGLIAGLSIGLPLLFQALRFVDPRTANYSWFEGFFILIRWALSLFLHGVFLSLIAMNLGYSLPMNNILLGGLGVLWVVIGNRMGQVRSNYFIGIRTPWTLADENNWRRTHRFGARSWVAAGLIMFGAAWFVSPPWASALVLICALGSSILPIGYSYLLYVGNRKRA